MSYVLAILGLGLTFALLYLLQRWTGVESVRPCGDDADCGDCPFEAVPSESRGSRAGSGPADRT